LYQTHESIWPFAQERGRVPSSGPIERYITRAADVLAMRFGIKDGNEYTLEQVGRHLGLTRERIRQIQSKAYQELRKDSELRHLRER